jgi:hypothetical protein
MTNNIKNYARSFGSFYWTNASMAWLLQLLSWLFAIITCPPSLIETLPRVLAFWVIAMVVLHGWTLRLDRRIQESGSPDWAVEVNGVSVGRLPDKILAEFQRKVALDGRVYVAQLSNLADGLVRAMGNLLSVIPVTVFWALLAWLVFSPETLQQTGAAFVNATPDSLSHAGKNLAVLAALLAVISIAFAITFSVGRKNSLGFQDSFRAATDDKIRQHLGCAAYGQVRLSPTGHMLTSSSRA